MALDEQRTSRNADDDDGNAEKEAEPKMGRLQVVLEPALRARSPRVFAQALPRFVTPKSDAESMDVEPAALAHSRRVARGNAAARSVQARLQIEQLIQQRAEVRTLGVRHLFARSAAERMHIGRTFG